MADCRWLDGRMGHWRMVWAENEEWQDPLLVGARLQCQLWTAGHMADHLLQAWEPCTGRLHCMERAQARRLADLNSAAEEQASVGPRV